MGDIVVTGMAMVAPSNSIPSNQIAAQGGVDFSIVPVSITLGDGETVGEIVVPLPMDNEVSGPPKVFHFTLSEVQNEALPPQGTSIGIITCLQQLGVSMLTIRQWL